VSVSAVRGAKELRRKLITASCSTQNLRPAHTNSGRKEPEGQMISYAIGAEHLEAKDFTRRGAHRSWTIKGSKS